MDGWMEEEVETAKPFHSQTQSGSRCISVRVFDIRPVYLKFDKACKLYGREKSGFGVLVVGKKEKTKKKEKRNSDLCLYVDI